MGNLSDAEYTGKGIGVCVMDTGLFPHIDFAGRIWVFRDFVRGQKQPYDDNSHGTHVCGIIGGDGTASMGRIRGIAPGCGFIALKVLDGLGNGRKEDVLQAIEWILKNRKKYGIRIVNISVGTTCRTKMDHKILIDGVEKLWDQGLVVVAAAGNQGPRPGSVTAPGSSRKIITVGSSDLLTGRSAISGRGPTFECVCKPDLVAPGSKIRACCPWSGLSLWGQKRHIYVYTAGFRCSSTDAGKKSGSYKSGNKDEAERKRQGYGTAQESSGLGGTGSGAFYETVKKLSL